MLIRFNIVYHEKQKRKSQIFKNGKNDNLLKVKKNTPDKSQFSKDEIREKANQIYLQRIERDEYGTAENDWLEAERLLENVSQV
jgi:hypothetical protein